MKDSLLLGAGSGVVAGAVIGSQTPGDQGENAIKGAVIGGVVLGLASYMIHNSLQKRDEEVRRDTLMNLEHYEVLGTEGVRNKQKNEDKGGKCYQTREVDGRVVSVPCYLVEE